MKLTVRLSKKNIAIRQLLKQNQNLVGPITNWGRIRGCELYYGTSYSDIPNWADFIISGTNSNITGLQNKGAAALMFLPIDNRYMIFIFGYGGHQLSGIGLETDFGIKVVLNTVDAERIRSIDSKKHETVVINRRTQLSKEKGINDFGFEINKDFLKQIVGKPANENFAISLAGSDSLILNTHVTSQSIESKANEIYGFYNSTNYQVNFEWFDNIKPLKDRDTIEDLNEILLNEFNLLIEGNDSDIQMASPTIIDYNSIAYFRIRGYSSEDEINFINIENVLIDLLSNAIDSLTYDEISKFRIESYDSSDTLVSSWKFFDWILYETELNRKSYFLSEGEWYEVSTNYLNTINNSFNSILNSPTEFLRLPATNFRTEEDYISNYTPDPQDEIILDGNCSMIYGGNNRIEICDIYNVQKEFIHVKEGGSSAKLSHLFNQGYVSSSLFLNDTNFRDDMITKLRTHPQLSTTITNPLVINEFTVVYRVIKTGRNFRLPFFSRITLQDLRKKIINMGYRFRLEWVPKN